MNDRITTSPPSRACSDSGSTADARRPTVRQVLQELRALDCETARYLNALAFVLVRVADADLRICERELACIEEILVNHAGVRPEHAMLVVEIARHRCQIADCGASYTISRDLRTEVDEEQRAALGSFLVAVGQADGRIDERELRIMDQLARELGCTLPLDQS